MSLEEAAQAQPEGFEIIVDTVKHGVHDANVSALEIGDVELVAVRDLAAICAQRASDETEPEEDIVPAYHEVVAAYAMLGPVLPAPVGLVFRAPWPSCQGRRRRSIPDLAVPGRLVGRELRGVGLGVVG